MPNASSTPRTRRRSEGGFLLGMFVGVVLGLAVALAIAFYLNKSPVPFQTARATKSAKELASGKPPAERRRVRWVGCCGITSSPGR